MLPRRSRLTAFAALLAVAIPVAINVSIPSSSAASSQKGGHDGHDDGKARIFVIMLENHSQSSVIDDVNAPNITNLAHTYNMATSYFGVTHPSMPNYIATIAGDNFGIQDDNDQNVVNFDRRNLVDQLESHGLTWGAYMETLPANKTDRFGPVVGTAAVSLYAKKHNPFVLFDDIVNNTARMANVKDYSALSADLNSDNAPDFVWISPNQCNDMHGGVFVAVPGHPETPCPYGSTKDDVNDAALKQKADAFVQTAVQTIMGSAAWTKNSLIFIVTDENDFTNNATTGGWETADGCCDSPYVQAADPRINAAWPGGTYGGGLVPAVVITGHKPQGRVSQTPYNHFSLLATIEYVWHLGYLGHAGDRAGGVVPMLDLIH